MSVYKYYICNVHGRVFLSGVHCKLGEPNLDATSSGRFILLPLKTFLCILP